jgi:hypothetical protein
MKTLDLCTVGAQSDSKGSLQTPETFSESSWIRTRFWFCPCNGLAKISRFTACVRNQQLMNGPDALLWCKTLLFGKRCATIVQPDDRMLRKQIRLGACTDRRALSRRHPQVRGIARCCSSLLAKNHSTSRSRLALPFARLTSDSRRSRFHALSTTTLRRSRTPTSRNQKSK